MTGKRLDFSSRPAKPAQVFLLEESKVVRVFRFCTSGAMKREGNVRHASEPVALFHRAILKVERFRLISLEALVHRSELPEHILPHSPAETLNRPFSKGIGRYSL